MKNIHVLLTDKPSRLHLGNLGLVLCDLNFGKNTINGQHIYITNDEEIKEGDWVISDQSFLSPLYDAIGKVEIISLETKKIIQSDNSWYWTDLDCKKIILTTDQDLIKDGVQSIDDEFLEWFVKNPSCEEVEVDKGYRGVNLFNYKIIIPKEEPKQEMPIINGSYGCIIETNKQETLEESAERLSNRDGFVDGALFGVKWQQEQDKNKYSEEDLKEAFRQGQDNMDYSEMFGWDSKLTEQQWFEQFKNK